VICFLVGELNVPSPILQNQTIGMDSVHGFRKKKITKAPSFRLDIEAKTMPLSDRSLKGKALLEGNKNESPTLIFASRANDSELESLVEVTSKIRRTKVHGRFQGLSILLPVLPQGSTPTTSPYSCRQHRVDPALRCRRVHGNEYEGVSDHTWRMESDGHRRSCSTNVLEIDASRFNRQQLDVPASSLLHVLTVDRLLGSIRPSQMMERNEAVAGDSLVQEASIGARGLSRQQGRWARGDCAREAQLGQEVSFMESTQCKPHTTRTHHHRGSEAHEAHEYRGNPVWRQTANRISRSSSVQDRKAAHASEGKRWPPATGVDKDMLRRTRVQDEVDGPLAVAGQGGQGSSSLGTCNQRVWSGCASRAGLRSRRAPAGWVGQGTHVLDNEDAQATAQGSTSVLIRGSSGVWDGGPLRRRCLDLLLRRQGDDPRQHHGDGAFQAWDGEREGERNGSAVGRRDGLCADVDQAAGSAETKRAGA
jgi:hypothetical protein